MKMQSYQEETDRLLRGIAMRFERIWSYEGKVPAIEKDLALEEIRGLYDRVLQMQSPGFQFDSLSAQDAQAESVETEPMRSSKEVPVQPVAEMPVQPVEEILVQPVEEILVQPVAEMPVQPVEEILVQPVAEILVQPAAEMPVQPVAEMPVQPVAETSVQPVAEKPVQPVEKTPIKQVEVTEMESPAKPGKGGTSILADKLKREDHKSINDLIASGRSDQSISKRMQHHPIIDLKSAIGINEKFIFVYELFGGNSILYAETIDRLNRMAGRDAAIGLMETLRAEYRWDIENMAFQKLVDMVVRRYSV
jgi:hypothetical protein